jgi:hypothetical protein
MLRLLIDESFNQHVVEAVRRRQPDLDILNVTDVGLHETDDRVILERANTLGRVVVTSDVQTMVGFAYERIAAGEPTPGVIVGPMYIRVGLLIEDLLLVAFCYEAHEIDMQVKWLPIRH